MRTTNVDDDENTAKLSHVCRKLQQYSSQQRCSTIETAGQDVTNSKLPTVTIKLNRLVVCGLSANQTHSLTDHE